MTARLSHPVPLDDQLCFALYGASMAMTRAYKPLLDKLGITYPQYLVLHALWEEDGRTIGQLAERLALESSTITPLVKRLEAAGIVTRSRDPKDERHVHVLLAPPGEALKADAECLAETIFARTGLSLEEMQGLNRQIQILQRALSTPEQADA
ncbi:MarR family winged helix-turn-helix transcriptional regulator [Sphingomonas abaci]|uniref:DNA-binding MarR family transcriptional regulator n=1 Tax=Sphingomonas abaci TaxID=237611 RepID=A0A7W7AHB4_9SPHN|nr:MarR family transcriptional regulator [Sphingomonas abaci]MBB4617005.1 DNA-binding MarR family transcriptional regulator [Sphingomonas abaci]